MHFYDSLKNRVLTLKQSKKGMKKLKFSEAQIIKVLKSQEEGKKVSEI
jgi:hypothetical protein